MLIEGGYRYSSRTTTQFASKSSIQIHHRVFHFSSHTAIHVLEVTSGHRGPRDQNECSCTPTPNKKGLASTLPNHTRSKNYRNVQEKGTYVYTQAGWEGHRLASMGSLSQFDTDGTRSYVPASAKRIPYANNILLASAYSRIKTRESGGMCKRKLRRHAQA